MVAVGMGRLVRTGRGEVGLGPASPCVRAGRTYASLRTLLRGLMGGPSWVRKARSWVRVRSELRAGPRPAWGLETTVGSPNDLNTTARYTSRRSPTLEKAVGRLVWKGPWRAPFSRGRPRHLFW